MRSAPLGSLIAAGFCVVGGIVLLAFESADSKSYSLFGHSVFEAIGHGVGLYCIGRGIGLALSAGVLQQIRRDVATGVAYYLQDRTGGEADEGARARPELPG